MVREITWNNFTVVQANLDLWNSIYSLLVWFKKDLCTESSFFSNTASTYVVCLHNPYNLNNNTMEVKKASFLSYVSCLFLVIFLGCHRCLVSFSAQLSQKKYSYVKQATDAKSLLSYHMYCGKGGLKSESTGRFSNCPKNVPKTILIYYIQ